LSVFFMLSHKNSVYTTPVPHTCCIPRASRFSLFDHPNNSWLGVQITTVSSSLCSLPQSLVALSLLGPKIFNSSLYSNTHSLPSTLSVSDKVSHP
jgi:hypothetical protein